MKNVLSIFMISLHVFSCVYVHERYSTNGLLLTKNLFVVWKYDGMMTPRLSFFSVCHYYVTFIQLYNSKTLRGSSIASFNSFYWFFCLLLEFSFSFRDIMYKKTYHFIASFPNPNFPIYCIKFNIKNLLYRINCRSFSISNKLKPCQPYKIWIFII